MVRPQLPDYKVGNKEDNENFFLALYTNSLLADEKNRLS